MPSKLSEFVLAWRRLWSRETLGATASSPGRRVHPGHPEHPIALHWILEKESLPTNPVTPDPSPKSFGLRRLLARESLPPTPPLEGSGMRRRSLLRWVLTSEDLHQPSPTGGDHFPSPLE